MVNPPNLTSSRQNWNLDSLNMMPFWAHGVVAIMQQHRALSSWYEGESGMQDGTGRQCHAFLVYTDCSSTESPQCVTENYPSWLWLPWHCTSLSVCPLGLEQWCHACHHFQDQLWQLTLNEMGLEWECVVLLGWHLIWVAGPGMWGKGGVQLNADSRKESRKYFSNLGMLSGDGG